MNPSFQGGKKTRKLSRKMKRRKRSEEAEKYFNIRQQRKAKDVEQNTTNSFSGTVSDPKVRLIPGKRLGKKHMMPTGKGKITRKMLKKDGKNDKPKEYDNKFKGNQQTKHDVKNTKPKVKELKSIKPRLKDDKVFTSLVNNYKKKLMVATEGKKKWFTQ